MRRTLGRITILLITLTLTFYGINAPPAQAAPAITLGLSSGTPGTVLGISGTGFGANENGITVNFDGAPVQTGVSADVNGAWSATITVPHVAAGGHPVAAIGPVSGTVSATFTVTAGISLSQTSGPPGTTVTVTGIGFANQETGITVTYDGTSIVPGQVASSQGDWTASFGIPSSPSGSHSITAYGSSTSTTRTIIFSITPTVTLNKTSGAPGSSVTVSGSGFAASESSIVVNYDGSPIASSIAANSQGGWTATITIPPSPAGSHTLHAYGSITSATATSDQAFIVGAGISATTTSGPPGTSLTVTGSGFGTNETGITLTYDNTNVGTGIRANGTGGWTTTFNVPNSAGGSHTIQASGSTTSSVPSISYTVTPVVSAAQPNAAPGSSLTVTGAGFAANETGITVVYDTTNVATGIRANAQGSWTATFLVPASSAGTHALHATGSVTAAGATEDVLLTVTAGITASQTSGSPGTSITVTGSGFTANETGITVTYDGANVATGLRANAQGGFTATFNVPNSAAGPHNLHSFGATTLASTTSDLVFTVTPGITASQTTGAPGSSLTVNGSGFAANETGITVTYDNANVATGLRANAQGSWNTTFTVPPSAAGGHSIGAFGAVSQVATVTPLSFTTAAGLTLTPPAGFVGATVQIEGSGFAVNSPLKLSYDDQEISATGLTTDATGSFSKSITIPKSKAGPHTIRAIDGQRNDVKATFTMDSAAPPVPAPQSPDDGSRVGVLGGVMPAFKWASVTDPSGVTYELQVDNTPEFTQPLLDKPDLARNNYTLTAAEALPLGEYYWRVKAIDGASNQSAWSQPRVLKAGLMTLTTLLLIIFLAVAALAAAAYFFFFRRLLMRRRAAAGAGAEGEAPRVVVTGQWRSIEAPEQEAATPRGERPLPLRLALPQPEKGKKALSTEEQARLKVIVDFAQSLPLVQAGYTTSWLLDLLESGTGIEASLPIYEQLLKGELQVRYEPAWTHHPTYQDLTSLLEGQPVLQDLNAFVDAVNRCAAEATSILQDIYRDCLAEVPMGLLERGGWSFVSAVYADATSWFLGKSLRDPSERDYSIKPRSDDESGSLWLYGEDATSFGGPLMQASDEKEGQKIRGLHLKLRRNYRNSPKAKEVVGMMTQLDVQRSRLLNVFSQFGRLKQ